MSVLRAVVDTNVLVSGAVGSTSPAQVIDAWRQNKYVLVTSSQLIGEVGEVMTRPRIMEQFGFTKGMVADFVGTLSSRAYVTAGSVSVDVIKDDPDDNWVLAAAMEGGANYILTGDKQHLLPLGSFQEVKIVTPAEFLKKLD